MGDPELLKSLAAQAKPADVEAGDGAAGADPAKADK
jgi:hypothetical protein